ncbi:MAG: flagellar export protein FliJ [Pseudomonadota bacterium]
MTRRSARLSRIAQLKALARQRMERNLGDDLRSLAQSRQQHEMLLDYQSTYQDSSGPAMNASALRNRQSFLQSIGRAITQQETRVKLDVDKVKTSRANWIKAWRNAKAMDEWVSEVERREHTDRLRRQQSLADEMLNTRYRRD